jgi:protein involved in polysaccharide export with SLBB domain
LSQAVAVAGGFTPRSKHSQVVVFRQVSDAIVESHVVNVKTMMKSRSVTEDLRLQPGDFIFVPQNTLSKIHQFLPVSSLSLYATPNQF